MEKFFAWISVVALLIFMGVVLEGKLQATEELVQEAKAVSCAQLKMGIAGTTEYSRSGEEGDALREAHWAYNAYCQ